MSIDTILLGIIAVTSTGHFGLWLLLPWQRERANRRRAISAAQMGLAVRDAQRVAATAAAAQRDRGAA